MNKVLCILLLLGAIGAFVLSQRESYMVRDHDRRGWPVGEEQIVHLQTSDRFFYIAIGVAFMTGFLYSLAKLRKADLRRLRQAH